MKKLMMAAAIVCAAVVSQAAQCQWTVQGLTDSPDVAKTTGWAAYLMPASTYTEFTALTADKVAGYVAANNVGEGETVSAARVGLVATGTTGSYAKGESENAYVVLFNNASADAATYYAYTETKTSPAVGDGGANITITYANGTSAWQSTAAAPEPTSGLLLLLGVAGLALRRRRA